MKALNENQRKVIIVILFLKNMEKVRFERIVLVSLIFASVEVVHMIWYFLLPRRPMFMAMLQILATMILKYAFIGFDDTGIVAYFK